MTAGCSPPLPAAFPLSDNDGTQALQEAYGV